MYLALTHTLPFHCHCNTQVNGLLSTNQYVAVHLTAKDLFRAIHGIGSPLRLPLIRPCEFSRLPGIFRTRQIPANWFSECDLEIAKLFGDTRDGGEAFFLLHVSLQ